MITYTFINHTDTLTESSIADINTLLKQLNSTAPEIDERKILETSKHSFILLAKEDQKIIGIGTLCPAYTTKDIKGHIEDVVVHTSYRGKGIGKEITIQLIKKAKDIGANMIELTSNPNRVEANKLYQKLGFVLRTTNAYKLNI